MKNSKLIEITSNEFELIKITLRVLDKFSKFDLLKIYELDSQFEIYTVCHSEKYVTRTIIRKCNWRASECYYKIAGEDEVRIK